MQFALELLDPHKRELGIEEHVELLDPDLEDFCEEKMAEFVHENQQRKGEYYLYYLD